MVEISKFSFDNPRFVNLLNRKAGIPVHVEKTVSEILYNVQVNGDAALYSYMKEFDKVDIAKIGLMVSDEEFETAKKMVSQQFKESVKHACENLFEFHRKQFPKSFEIHSASSKVVWDFAPSNK